MEKIGKTNEILHSQICANMNLIQDWYAGQISKISFPIYSSYDIRDAGYKISNVDANIYPAGFNNICPADQEGIPELFQAYLKRFYGVNSKRILLITEEHTNNPYYWHNVATIKRHLEAMGSKVLIAFPRKLEAPLELTTSIGEKLMAYSGDMSSAEMREFQPQIVISNNDFSDAREDWAHGMTLPINPPRELGWYQRKKSNYFTQYNRLAVDFANLIKVDPFLLTVKTKHFDHFEIKDDSSVELLAKSVDELLLELAEDYRARGIEQKPFAFVKNNSGTYGLAVIKVASGDDIRAWNYKNRKKMKAAKGGREVEEVIIQEGIPSIVRADGASAEPVIYMVGCQLAGGFLRTHAEKSDSESLNSPGAVYKRLCISDLAVDHTTCPMENVYGWSAKLGLLAIANEGQSMGVSYKDFTVQSCQTGPRA